MNTDVVMASRTLLWISKRSANWVEAGAIMDEETGLMNVNADTMKVAPHFCLKLQLRACKVVRRMQKEKDDKAYFLGFSGSSGPSQSTMRTLSLLVLF
jgi:hypothetical protein